MSQMEAVAQGMQSVLGSLPAEDLAKLLSRFGRSTNDDAGAAAGGTGAAPSDSGAPAASEAAGAAAALGLSVEQLPGAWKALASIAGKVIEGMFTPVAYLDNERTDTQVRGFRPWPLTWWGAVGLGSLWGLATTPPRPSRLLEAAASGV